MRQLLDTHTFIWFAIGSDRINSKVRKQIDSCCCQFAITS
jgi:PIN domain nuclease of toxin-antitoxin system